MHVPGIETTQHPAEPKTTTSKTESSGVFAAFLQDIQKQDVSLLRIAGSLAFKPDLADLTGSTPPLPIDDPTDVRDAVASDPDNENDDTGDDKPISDRNDENDDQSATVDDGSRPHQEMSPTDVVSTDAAVLSNIISNTGISSESTSSVAALSSGTDSAKKLTPVGHQAASQAETVDKAPSINPLTKNQNAAGAQSAAQPAKVTVTEEKAPLHSRPASTLASSATVAAQTAAQSPAAKATSTPTEPTATSGNLLLNAAANKESAQNQAGQQHTGQQPAKSGIPTPPATNPTAQPVPTTPASITMAPAAQPAATGATLANSPATASSSFGDALTSATGPVSAPPAVERPGQILSKPPAPPSAPPRPMTDQIAVQIRKAVDQGVDKIRIQLRPAELGRVDIKLDIGADGRVAVSVSAERPETIDLLQRDARGLQQALQDAGLSADSGSLSFNLSGQNDGENAPSSGNADADGEAQSSDDAVVADDTGPRRASDSLIDVEV